MATFTGVAHVAVVVRDMQSSVRWYEQVLGFDRQGEVQDGPSGAGHPRQLMRHPESGFVLGVHEPLDRTGDAFDPSRTGLDHIALTVADKRALDEWTERLDQLEISHSPRRDAGYAEFISIFDPNGIQWELWAAKPH